MTGIETLNMRDCGCGLCRDEYKAKHGHSYGAVKLAKVEPVKVKPEPEQRVPRGLADLRKTVTDFYKSPEKFLDFSTIRARGGGDYIVSGKSFEDVTGLTRLGSGAYSEVFAIDDTRVLKIVKSQDSGYARFVKMVRDNPKNIHFTKIHYQGTWGGKTVYILERLEEDSGNVSDSYYGDTINQQFRDAIRTGGGDNPFYTLATPMLAQAASLLADMINDLHAGNVMFRINPDGTRTPVVTDPATD